MHNQANAGTAKPICVDLDGTLIRTDALVEGFLSIISKRKGIGKLLQLMTLNRAALKQKVGALSSLAPELLPYNMDLIEYLRAQKHAGRMIVLATAADGQTARAIADHVGLDE